MWYVSAVEKLALYSDTRFLDPILQLNKANPNTCRATVKLTDTETCQTVSLRNYENSDRFFKLMESYKPYGYFPDNEYHGSMCFMPIDPLSIKFLDYIDRVEVVTVDSESPPYDFLAKVSNELLGICESCDKEHSLFKITYQRVYKTLLQILCMKPCQSFGDVFYIYNMDVELATFSAFKVIFSNVTAAKRMIAKCSLKWSEPWSRYAMWG